jgi:hypothetical protein
VDLDSVGKQNAIALHSGDQHAGDHLDTPALENALRVAPELLRQRRQQPRGALDQNDASLGSRQAGILPPQDELQQFDERAGVLDARWAAADHQEGQPAPSLDLIVRRRGVLEACEHVVAKPLGLLERLHAQRGLGEVAVAEVVVLATSAEDEIVVTDPLPARGSQQALLESTATILA